MSAFLPLTFGAPYILLALAALPAIWWLLRVTPPTPHRMRFPAIRLLLGVKTDEESPAHTPWWVLLLRLVLAAVLIIALAAPIWNAAPPSSASGPYVLVVDNTWAAALGWDERTDVMRTLIDQATRDGEAVVFLPTAPGPAATPLTLYRPGDARDIVGAIAPQPFLADYDAQVESLTELQALLGGGPAQISWLSDGLDGTGRAFFAEQLNQLGPVSVYTENAATTLALLPPQLDREGFMLSLCRATALDINATGNLRAIGGNGRTLGSVPFTFEENSREVETLLRLPLELRNEVTRIEIEGHVSAGAVALVDESAQRRAVGIVSGASTYDEQPLLSEMFYLDRALGPYADLREGPIEELLAFGIDVLVLADVGELAGSEYEAVRDFVSAGGVLIRFAGPRLASLADDLLPVRLRAGDRALGGSLAWATPQGLLPFADTSPFAGLDISEDVLVGHQVLAEPEIELAGKTWARLSDGTPLVTGARSGDGWLVLFHVTANQDWSSLAASGLYVEMLQRLLPLSVGGADHLAHGQAQVLLPPLAILDGYGRLQTPPPTVEPISARNLADMTPSPRHPPGLYGTEIAASAINTVSAQTQFEAPPDWGPAIVRTYQGGTALVLQPLLLAIAVALFLLDFTLALLLAGHFALSTRWLARLTPALLGMVLLGFGMTEARAQDDISDGDRWLIEAVNELHLAYVITGDQASDDMARAGLAGLTRSLFARTTVEPADPIGVDLTAHELSVFPMLFWRVAEGQPPLSDIARERLATYMRNGGTLFIDTANEGTPLIGGGRSATLRRHLRGLDVPPLAPVPEDHVLTRAFYLLSEFPGRFAGGDVWVEAPGPDGLVSVGRDGVSPIIIGSNDFAAAWATDDAGRPLAAVAPGGERQREISTRFGINLVMYVLTGNYKSDQVHIPALLERLGQ